MRLWLKDSERRPDPVPVASNDATAIVTGLVLWLLALIATLVFSDELAGSGHAWWLATCIIGIGLGLAGMLYTRLRRR